MSEDICGECDEPVTRDHPSAMYDGVRCHLHCIAEAMDESDFDSWFIDK